MIFGNNYNEKLHVMEEKMKEIDPKQTKRAKAYKLWMKAPNQMVTFFKTLDVTPLVNKSKKSKLI